MPVSLHSQANPVPLADPIDAEGRQWAMIVPVGTIKTLDRRGPFTLNNASEVIAASFAHANTGSLPIDINHSIDLEAKHGRPSPAAGWITHMEERKDGIWGHIEWTANAARSIREKEYRFLSPVVVHTPDKEVLAVARASLTNSPNLTMTALNAAEKEAPMDIEAMLAALRSTLSLASDADNAAIVAAVGKLTESRNSADPAQFVPIDIFQKTLFDLNELRSGVSLQAAEMLAEQAVQKRKILPYMKPSVISVCQTNKAVFDDFLEGAGKPVADLLTSLQTSVDYSSNRQRDRERDGSANTKVTAVTAILGHSADDIKKYGEGAN